MKANNENGQAVLLITLMVMSILLMSSLFSSRMVLRQTAVTNNIYHSAQAYFLSDSAAENFLYAARKGTVSLCPEANLDSLVETNFAGGTYKVELVGECGVDNATVIKASGVHKNTNRAVQITY